MATRVHTLLLALAVLAAFAAPGSALGEPAPVALTVSATEDVSFPFWCDWGYDWGERCWWENGDRLPVGGDEDKVWRAGVRFSLGAVPAGAEILEASLGLRHEAVCLGPRKTTRACAARRYTLDLHPILSAAWFAEREVELGPVLARAVLPLATRAERLTWDVTDLVAAWVAGEQNDGVLLKLAESEEDFGVGGPALPSSTFGNVAARPTLTVVYVPPG